MIAYLTDLARMLRARREAEAMVLGDWSFQVGTFGYDTFNPTQALPVDTTLNALVAPVGGSRPLGRVLLSGTGAAVTLTGASAPGFAIVTGLVGMPATAARRWLRLSGSASPTVNGTWFIGRWLDATSVEIQAPLITADDAGPLTWEFRGVVMLRPNPRATDFHGRVVSPDAADGMQLSEVGIFGRVLAAPTLPTLVGNSFLYACAHHPARTLFTGATLNCHVCIQS